MIKPWDTLDVVERHPDVVSGAWVFRGTRVPVAALFENLRDGATIDQFLEWFPGVSRAQVEAVLDYEVQNLTTADQNLRYQQNLTGRRLALVVLQSTSWPRIRA